MIYLEGMEVEGSNIQIFRLRNDPGSAWYGINLCYVGDKIIADNGDFMATTLYNLLVNKKYREAMEELQLPYNKAEAKAIKKLIKEAYKLGWFATV